MTGTTRPNAETLASSTIFALATPPLPAFAAMMRVSGPLAPVLLDLPWRRGSVRATLQLAPGPTPCLAWLLPAPRTLTCDDTLELFVPGHMGIVRALSEWLADRGCCEAEPGEFTRRALLAGRLDLAAAQATLALVTAVDETARRRALADLHGQTGRALAALAEQLRAISARYAMSFDFSEEEHAQPEQATLLSDLRHWHDKLAALLGADQGRAQHDSPTVALFGPPNAGKSSLFNALLGAPHALVSDLPGTTRDAVARPARFGADCTLLDLSGVGDADTDAGRFAGVSRQRALAADVLLVLCAPGQADACARGLATLTGQDPSLRARAIWVQTMSDLSPQPPNPCGLPHCAVSAASGAGLDELREMLAARLNELAAGGLESLQRAKAREALMLIGAALDDMQAPPEATAGQVRRALVRLDEAQLSEAPGDVLALIFSRFCIGK